jgi:tRNA (guanine37-N1)-methyltransferase
MSVTLQIDLLTLFPDMVRGVFTESMLGRAAKRGLVAVKIHNLRDWAPDKHQVTDDRPFGGGAGMLMKPEPLAAAIEDLRSRSGGEGAIAIYMTPDASEQLTTPLAQEFSQARHLIIVSGHYEGIDQRIRDSLIDREVSIGDFVLTNGTLAAAVLVDAVARYVPGVLGDEDSLAQDSFSDGLLTHPQYTRPAEFRGMGVPNLLLSGDHAAIDRWRHEQRLEKTRKRRPDLLGKANRIAS